MGGVPLLRIEGVSKRFGAVQALDDAGFDIARGEVVAVLGDNGPGKSPLVKVISGTCVPDRGGLSFDGRPVHIHNPADSKRLGIEKVYQDLSLCENMNVR